MYDQSKQISVIYNSNYYINAMGKVFILRCQRKISLIIYAQALARGTIKRRIN